MRTSTWVLLPLFMLLVYSAAFAGGPLYVGGNYGVSGKPYTWDNSGAIQYRVDGGTLGKLNHTDAVQLVNTAFGMWPAVPTAKLTLQNAGSIPATGAFTDGDVSTVQEFDAVWGACVDTHASTHINPVIFDNDGSIMRDLGADADVLGFESTCIWGANGRFVSALMAINGAVYSGMSDDLTLDEMYAVIEHEFGHFLGLDHSQINMTCIESQYCTQADIDGIPTMFPAMFVQSGGFQKSLSEDDQAWISYLYPVTTAASGKVTFNSVYGIISGDVLFPDGLSGVQGMNITARKNVNGVLNHAISYSAVSGYLFTGNPGQTVTGDNISEWTGLPGSDFGSRSPALIGHFDIPVRGGATYTLEVNAIYPGFTGGSSVGPIGNYPPDGRGVQISVGALEGTTLGPINVSAGATSANNKIQMQSGPSRFDQYESQ